MRTRLILLCLLLADPALFVESAGHAQTRVDIRSQSKSVDFSAADSTKPFKTGTTLPASCLAGEAFLKKDAAPGSNIYLCLTPNAWTQVASSSGTLNVGSGSVTNRPANCSSGQLYFNTDAGAEGWSYCQTPGSPGTWSVTFKGADGYSPQYRVAAGPPSSGIGNAGDMYLNSTTGDLYGPKTASSWGNIVANLKGAAGPICGISGQLLMNSGGACAGATPTGTGAPVQANGPSLTAPMLSAPSTGTGPITETWTCSGAVNTAYTLVKLDTSASGAILPLRTSDTAPYGIAVSTCAAGSTVQVARFGRIQCVADTNGAGMTAPGNAAVISATFDGYCMDSGKAVTAVGNLTRLVGTIQNVAATGALVTVALTPSQYGNQVTQSTLPPPYNGWQSNTLLSGGGAGASPVITSVTIDPANNIATPGALNTGAGSGSAGSIVALRGTGTAMLGVQGASAGEWDITAPANFNSWSFTPPAAPCGAHQWWTTDSNGIGNCTQPASPDLADASSLALLGAAQTFTGDKTFAGKLDASGAAHTIPAKVGVAASKPAACTVGEMYFATDAAAGRNWYFCTAANTWTQQVASGSGASIPNVTNLLAGDGAGNGADSGIAVSSVALKNGANAYTGTQDASGAAHTIPAKVGVAASKPATCTVGEMYFATDAAAGRNWYFCTATNTWTQQVASGSGASIPNVTNLLAGDGAGNGTDSGIAVSSVALKNGANAYTGTQDASGAAHTIPAKVGVAASKPATCTVGEMYFATDAAAGRNWYFCTAANTWTQQVASGSGASIPNVTNLLAGDGAGNGTDSGIAVSSVALKNGANAYTGTQDASGASHTIPAKVGAAASKPATCTVGEMYFATDAAAGRNWYFCTAANTWTQQVASGSGASIPNVTNLLAGDGAGNGADSGIAVSSVALKNGANAYTGTQDASGAAHTIPAKVGVAASKPATCSPGEEYFATDATAGQNKYYCTASNTWTQQLNSGGGGGAVDCTDPTVTCLFEPFAPGSNGNLLIGTLGWNVVGAPGVTGYTSPGAGIRGGYQITSGAAANNTTDVELGGGSGMSQFPRLSDLTNWTALYKFTTPSNLTEYILEIGFDTTASSGNILTLGAYLRYANSTGCDNTNHPNLSDTTWVFVSKDGSGANVKAGPAIAANTTYWLRLRNTATAGHVLANIKAAGGTWLANDVDLSTNLPALAVLPMFKQTICNTTPRTLQLNWFSWVKTEQN